MAKKKGRELEQFSLGEVVDGLLLGDGFVSKHDWQNNSYFSLSQVQWRLSWLRLLKDFFEVHGFTASIRPRRYTNSNVLHVGVSEVFNHARDKFYPSGHKEVPRIVTLTPVSALKWYLGDGSLVYSRNSPQLGLGACSFSWASIGYLRAELYRVFEVRTSVTTQVGKTKRYPVLRLIGGREAVHKFLTSIFIPELVPEVFYYKFNER